MVMPFTYGFIDRLAEVMLAKGIKPELEIYQPGQYWVSRGLAERGLIKPPYSHQFVMGVQTAMYPTPWNVLAMIQELPPRLAVHGRRHRQVPVAAGHHGHHPRRQRARRARRQPLRAPRPQARRATARRCEKVVRLAGEFGREIATPAQAREMLGLSRHTKQLLSRESSMDTQKSRGAVRAPRPGDAGRLHPHRHALRPLPDRARARSRAAGCGTSTATSTSTCSTTTRRWSTATTTRPSSRPSCARRPGVLGAAVPAPIALQGELAERLCARTPSIDRVRFTNSGLRGRHDGRARGPRLHRQGRLHHAGQRLSTAAGTRCCWPAPTRSTRTAPQGGVPAGIPKALTEVVHFVRFNDLAHLEELLRAARIDDGRHPARADPRAHPRARRPGLHPRRPATRARARRPADPGRDHHLAPVRGRLAGGARHRGRPHDHGQDDRRRHAGRRLRRQGARHADPRPARRRRARRRTAP